MNEDYAYSFSLSLVTMRRKGEKERKGREEKEKKNKLRLMELGIGREKISELAKILFRNYMNKAALCILLLSSLFLYIDMK